MDKIIQDALDFIKKGENRKKLWRKFASNIEKENEPFTYFMAGAPGSGKTEIVRKYLIDIFKNCIIADADEIREFIPQYTGKNSYKVQKAASKGMDILYDNALKYGLNILVDGTFALDYKKCEENIERSLKRGRGVAIFYLYTHPRVAWTYAKKREYTSGRKIKIAAFLRAFYDCRENVDKIKKKFGNQVYLVGMKSSYKTNKIPEIKANIQNVDEIQKIDYTYISLLARVLYANILLQRERILWKIKKMIKK